MLTFTASRLSAAFSCTRHGDPRTCNGHAQVMDGLNPCSSQCPRCNHPPTRPGHCSHDRQHNLRLPTDSTICDSQAGLSMQVQRIYGTSSAHVPDRWHICQQQSKVQDSSLQHLPLTWDVHTGCGALTRLLLTVNEVMFT